MRSAHWLGRGTYMEYQQLSLAQGPLSPQMRDERVNSLQRKLAERGHRTTPQRLHILQALLEIDTHPTAEEVWEKVRLTSPTTSLGTVYKTLDTLKELGEVMEVDARDTRQHYDAIRPTSHPHVVCSQCGRIEDVLLEDLKSLQARAADVSGYHIVEQQVTFYGLCCNCRPGTAARSA